MSELFEDLKKTMNTQTATYRIAYQEGYTKGYEDAIKVREEAMERQLKEEDISDILYEMKRDDQVDEHEDN